MDMDIHMGMCIHARCTSGEHLNVCTCACQHAHRHVPWTLRDNKCETKEREPARQAEQRSSVAYQHGHACTYTYAQTWTHTNTRAFIAALLFAVFVGALFISDVTSGTVAATEMLKGTNPQSVRSLHSLSLWSSTTQKQPQPRRRTTSNVHNAGNNGAVAAAAVTMGMMMLMK